MKRWMTFFRSSNLEHCPQCGNKSYSWDAQGVVRCDICSRPADSAVKRMEAKA